MNTTEGLERLAAVIRIGGLIVAVIIMLLGLAVAIFGGGGLGERFVLFLVWEVAGIIFCAISYALAWIIDGFAKPKQ